MSRLSINDYSEEREEGQAAGSGSAFAMAHCRGCESIMTCGSSRSSAFFNINAKCLKQLSCKDRHSDCDSYCGRCYRAVRDENQGLKKENEEIEFMRKWCVFSTEAVGTPDVTLCTSDGSRFPAHTLILGNRSDVFRTMFNIDFVEKRTGEVVVREVSGESVKVLLKFVYTAEASEEDMHRNYKELVKLAHFYQVKFLLLKLDRFIVENILTKETASEVLKMAYTYELEKSKKGAQEIIADNDLVDMAVKDLKGNEWMALDLSMFVINRLKGLGEINTIREEREPCSRPFLRGFHRL
ncbi:hypothetical protein KI387_028842, partial [Taxus chinensis]